MGKRELLLVAVFVVFGAVVYQATKPAGDPNRPGWSFGGIVEQIRREVRGNQGRVEVTTNQLIPAPPSLREIRIEKFPSAVVIVGEERGDIAVELKVISRAYDEPEARKTANETKVLVDEAGEMLRLTMDYPSGGQQTASLSIKVPKRLALRLEDKGGRLTVTGVAAVFIGGAGRGETVISDIAGEVHANQRGSSITIGNVGSLRLTTVSAGEVKISGVKGDATLNFTGGDIRIEKIAGAVEVDSRNAELRFEQLDDLRGPLRIRDIGGEIDLVGIKSETRIDGRESEVRVTQGAVAPLAIYNDNEDADAIEVTLAEGGMKIDAVANNGRITLDDALKAAGLKVESKGDNEHPDHRLEATIGQGGPALTLRAINGHIELRRK